MIRNIFAGFAVLLASACSAERTTEGNQADAFMDALSVHCGKAYEGRLVSTDEADADFLGQDMVMHVRNCDEGEIRVPFHVGDDRSRIWVITRIDGGLRLKHDHRHEDGEEDEISQYGGDALTVDDATRIAFPVDDSSIDLFNRTGLTASVTNVWALELTDDLFAYELRRTNRHFRIEFDLTRPVSPPPAPWGAQ